MTALQIVKAIQKELRLPQAQAVTEAHAALILSFANKVMRDIMTEGVVWDELKVYTSFNTVDGTSLYTVTDPNSAELDVIRNIQIGTNPPLIKYSDADFLAHKRGNTSKARPLVYRIRTVNRATGAITIEVSPTPDAAYAMDVEALKRPPKLVNDDDVPLLDADTIIDGAILVAKSEQGEDIQTELEIFKAKFGGQSGTQGESNWGDVESI